MATIDVTGIVFDDLTLTQAIQVDSDFAVSNLQAVADVTAMDDGTVKVVTTVTYESELEVQDEGASQEFDYTETANDQTQTQTIVQGIPGPPQIVMQFPQSMDISLTPPGDGQTP